MSKPMCFGFLMLLTWFLCQGGFLIALLAKENPVPTTDTPRPWSREMLLTAWRDKAFVRVLLLRAVGQLSYLPAAAYFVTYYGLKDLKMVAATVATGAMLGQVTRICASAPSGWLIDRWGAKRVWSLAPLAAAVVYAVTLLIPPDWMIPFPAIAGKIGLFGGPVAIYLSGMVRTAFLTTSWAASGVLLYGLPRPQHRPGYYTIQLLVDSIVPAVGAFVTGCMFDVISYRTGFWLMLAFSLLMYPLMHWLLRPLSNDPAAYA